MISSFLNKESYLKFSNKKMLVHIYTYIFLIDWFALPRNIAKVQF